MTGPESPAVERPGVLSAEKIEYLRAVWEDEEAPIDEMSYMALLDSHEALRSSLAAVTRERDDARRDSERLDWLTREHGRVDPMAAFTVKESYDRASSAWVNSGSPPRLMLDLCMKRDAARLAPPSAPARTPTDTERLEWWFAHGLTDSVCDGSVDLWWADGEAEVERVTHGTSIRDALDNAMRGIHDGALTLEKKR